MQNEEVHIIRHGKSSVLFVPKDGLQLNLYTKTSPGSDRQAFEDRWLLQTVINKIQMKIWEFCCQHH